jgi:hypothetical protein
VPGHRTATDAAPNCGGFGRHASDVNGVEMQFWLHPRSAQNRRTPAPDESHETEYPSLPGALGTTWHRFWPAITIDRSKLLHRARGEGEGGDNEGTALARRCG